MPQPDASLRSTPHGQHNVTDSCGVFIQHVAIYTPYYMEKDSDEQLMLQYQAGNADAFDMLYQRYRKPMYNYLLQQCHDRATADELFQDIWMKLIRAREHYQVKASFRTWLYHLAHNRLIDHFRRSQLRQAEQQGHLAPAPDELADPAGAGPDTQLDTQQQLQKLMVLVHELPTEQRDVFLLQQEAGLDLNAIAYVTGVAYETVKSRLRYALKRLRQGMHHD